jgi:hypothetical protein
MPAELARARESRDPGNLENSGFSLARGNDLGEGGLNESASEDLASAKRAIIDALRLRAKRARFTTELAASLQRARIDKETMDRALAELQTEGVVMIRDNFCADPHLAGVDLRVAALVESIDGADAQLSAIRVIDEAWNKWLGEYLSNHRCG